MNIVGINQWGWLVVMALCWGTLSLGDSRARAADKPFETDIVVIGGTPGGIAAAVTAARLGRRVVLTEEHRHLGAMSASGLGKTDIETPAAIGGLFQEFVARIERHYRETHGPDSRQLALCRRGFYYEPSVAEQTFDTLVAEHPGIVVWRHHRLVDVERQGQQIVAARLLDLSTQTVRRVQGAVFIDATYEGDLAAAAGAQYRLGRESRSEFGELHAGVVYQNYQTRQFLRGTTGAGDRRLQAYTYRLCLTVDPANSVPLREPPPDYDRTRYLGYLDDWRAGRLGPPVTSPTPGRTPDAIPSATGTVVRALSLAEIPNLKYDANMNPRPLGFPFVEENADYPEGDVETRERVSRRIRNLTLGLLYFLQNDPDVPAEHRALAQRYQLPRDEFADNGHFPWQLYVREARRIIGLYTLSEQDLVLGPELGRTRVHADTIAAGEYPIDSFPVRKREAGHDQVLEGYLLMQSELTHPYQIPYGIIVPAEIDGLLVPVAASTTHVAFSSIRLEPTWMALGQAAGTAAHRAIETATPLRELDVVDLQRRLLEQGQILTYFDDLDPSRPEHRALQWFGTRGWFPTYHAGPDDPVTSAQAVAWLALLDRRPAGTSKLDATSPAPLTQGQVAELFETSQSTDRSATASRGMFCLAAYQWLFPSPRPATSRGTSP